MQAQSAAAEATEQWHGTTENREKRSRQKPQFSASPLFSLATATTAGDLKASSELAPPAAIEVTNSVLSPRASRADSTAPREPSATAADPAKPDEEPESQPLPQRRNAIASFETSLPTLSAPWVSQTETETLPLPEAAPESSPETSPDAPASQTAEPTTERELPPDETPDPPDTTPDETLETPVETPTDPNFPRAATPEAFWSNGAVIEGGVLLPPSLPTNRPPTPLNLTADYQEFEPQNQILTARGNVVLRLGSGILSADRLWANLANRFVLVEGNVVFTRGEQTVEAERGEYNLIQEQGSLFNAAGVLFLPGVETDFGDIVTDPTRTPSVLETDPISGVRQTGSITFGTGLETDPSAGATLPDAGGFVRRIRFQAAQLDFDSEGWYAQDIRLTNDPFSPPELEFRGDSATLTRLTEFQDELLIENARLVFDQSFAVPLLRDRILLSRGGPDSANPLFVNVGFDGEDRDGLFLERTFQVASSGPWSLFVTPQLLAQRLVAGSQEEVDDESGFLSNLGLEADLTGAFGPTTGVEANASFSGLDINNLEERLRASVRVQQGLGDHTLNLEYSYRDRLFNGSLGFQDVQSSLGLVLVSPSIALGDTGIQLTYQASAQYITADTDRPDLLDPPPFRDLVSLGRFQGSVALVRGFTLWRGEQLPATPDAGLRFTSQPRRPNVSLFVGGRGTFTYYTSDDTQENLSASIGIAGELGHFSEDFFDSTIFNLAYRRSFTGDEGGSPFLFDRDVDQNVLSGGIIQQIYGPFRLGFQTSVNLDTGEVINTDYVFEYNRRTYGIVLRYSPTQESGFLGFRLNEFDWAGRAPRFGGADIRQVDGGVVQ